MSPARAILITGASGVVARRLLANSPPGRVGRIVCQSRQPNPTGNEAWPGLQVEFVRAGLLEAPQYEQHLAGIDTVVHLAAATGKARREEFFRVNVEGTQMLLDRCRTQGVRNFLYVSSIAARFRHADCYHYAQSKLQAEQAVRAGGLRFAIVRPTIIIGKSAAVWRSLSTLAKAPIMPVFGNGLAKIQPIDLDDLVGCLRQLIEQDEFAGDTFEVGGPEVVTIEEFLRRICRICLHREARVVHLPLRPLSATLAVLERYLHVPLPFTAGQLASFANDGTAEPNRLVQSRAASMKTIDQMIRLAAAG